MNKSIDIKRFITMSILIALSGTCLAVNSSGFFTQGSDMTIAGNVNILQSLTVDTTLTACKRP